MKQAILITGYKNVGQFLEIINFFGESFNFYIHIDKKSDLDLTALRKMDNVFISCKYVVNWAGINHLHAILLLADEALKNGDNNYFHLITAEDYPVKPVGYFKNIDVTKNYLEFFEMPAKRWGETGGMERLDYYNLYDIFNAKKPKSDRIIDIIISAQRKLGLKRGYYHNFPQLYGGSTYWSLNRDAVAYVIDYTQTNKKFLRRIKYTYCPEEMYFQTIIMNSAHAASVVNDNLRYIDWESGKGGYPAFLDEDDFQKVISSNALFARKLDIDKGKGLKLLITGYLAKSENAV